MNTVQLLRHSALGALALGAITFTAATLPASAGGGVTDAPVPGVTDCPPPGVTDAPVPGVTDSPVPGSGHGHGSNPKVHVKNHLKVDQAKALAAKLKEAQAKCQAGDCSDLRALTAQAKLQVSSLRQEVRVVQPRR